MAKIFLGRFPEKNSGFFSIVHTYIIICNNISIIHFLSARCETSQASQCKALGFNTSYVPNLAAHKSQREAMEYMQKLEASLKSCSYENSKLFMCALLFPPCTTGLQYTYKLPCRQLCEGKDFYEIFLCATFVHFYISMQHRKF